MYIATPLAILFLVITAAWTGIFAVAFARMKSARPRTLLADCFWIGVPSLCMVAALALLMQSQSEFAPVSSSDTHEHVHASVAEHKRECILDSQTQRIAAQYSAESFGTGQSARYDTATRPTQQR